MKKITIALAMVAATMLTACSDPEEEAKEREAELAQQLTTETLSTYRGSPWSDSKSDVLKVYLKQNGVTESELDGFRNCLTEYANTKSTTLKTTEVLGWCLNEYKDIPEKFKSHIDLGKLFKSTLNNRLHRNLACVIDKSSRGAKLERAFEELPLIRSSSYSALGTDPSNQPKKPCSRHSMILTPTSTTKVATRFT